MKLGLLLSHDGPIGVWTPGCKAAVRLAVEQVNAGGGINGRPLDLVTGDAGASSLSAFDASRRMVIDDRVDAVVGLQPSNMRAAVERGLGGLVPYFYTAEWEGGRSAIGTAALGLTEAQSLRPGIARLAELRNARRFFFVGNDYLWPHVAYGMARSAVAAAGAQMVGSVFLPFGKPDHEALLARIEREKPDVVLVVMLGNDALDFNRAFGASGLARHVLRFCLALDETQLLGIGAENTENLWAAQSYFLSQSQDGRVDMVESYRERYDTRMPPPNHASINCYDAVHIAAGLARRTRFGDGAAMARRVGGRMTRDEAYALSDRKLNLNRVQLAEADGLSFVVRAEL